MQGTLFGGRYRLQTELGRGAMGAVWRGRDERLGRDVAVKVMADKLVDNDEARQRFEREAKAVARVSSPHIVQMHDFGVEPQAFMVMELLSGESLSDRLQRLRTIEPASVVDIVMQCARGLSVAHDAGIVHRDLKPGNLFLADNRGADLVKLVDFGLAKAFRGNVSLDNITAVGEASGTPRYMSPEQLRAIEDARDDVWSLAVIAYRCLSGGVPFEAPSMLELVQSILENNPTPIRRHDQRLSPAVDHVFARAFHKERDARYPSAMAFAYALEGALTAPASQPVEVHMDAPTEPIRMPTQPLAPPLTLMMQAPPVTPPPAQRAPRSPWLVIGIVAVAMLCAGAIAFAVVMTAEPETSDDEEEEAPRKKKKRAKASPVEQSASASPKVPPPVVLPSAVPKVAPIPPTDLDPGY